MLLTVGSRQKSIYQEESTMNQENTRRHFLQRLATLGMVGIGVAVPFLEPAATQAQGPPPPPPPAPPDTTWKATIIPADEPGERLVVSGTVFAPDGQHVVPGIFVYAYNTDKQGNYSPDGRVYPPRLKGYLKTDEEGRFELHTILPGRYPKMHVPAHIHFTLWGAGYPMQWVDELRFEGDSYLTDEMRRESESRREFATIRPLTRDRDKVYRCSVKLRLQEKSNYPGQ
jgi:protocatechuate 3,4-dioxygenase, beta subunit